jgi:hypothetical protein
VNGPHDAVVLDRERELPVEQHLDSPATPATRDRARMARLGQRGPCLRPRDAVTAEARPLLEGDDGEAGLLPRDPVDTAQREEAEVGEPLLERPRLRVRLTTRTGRSPGLCHAGVQRLGIATEREALTEIDRGHALRDADRSDPHARRHVGAGLPGGLRPRRPRKEGGHGSPDVRAAAVHRHQLLALEEVHTRRGRLAVCAWRGRRRRRDEREDQRRDANGPHHAAAESWHCHLRTEASRKRCLQLPSMPAGRADASL